MKDNILLRNRPRARAFVLTVFLALTAFVLYGVMVEPRQLNEVRHDVTMAAWPSQCDGLRVDLVSDTHTGSLNNGIDNLDRLVNKLIADDSDIVVLAGDYVILSVLGGTFVNGKTVAKHLAPLTQHKPVYAVLGNHDWWKGGLELARHLGAAGVRVIDNRAVKLSHGSCKFWLVGIGDLDEGHPDIPFAMAQTQPDPSLPIIALTHNPKTFPQIPARVPLTLTGHTHGGQIQLPFDLYPTFWLKFGTERRYIDGLYQDEASGKQLFVTRGIGTSIVPIRLGVPPEISQLTLRSKK